MCVVIGGAAAAAPGTNRTRGKASHHFPQLLISLIVLNTNHILTDLGNLEGVLELESWHHQPSAIFKRIWLHGVYLL